MDNKKEHVIETLEKMNISYEVQNHPPVFTMEEMESHHICDKADLTLPMPKGRGFLSDERTVHF